MPATTVETLIYKLDTENKSSKTFTQIAKEILVIDKFLNALSGTIKSITGNQQDCENRHVYGRGLEVLRRAKHEGDRGTRRPQWQPGHRHHTVTYMEL